jgi:hypothetical protein
MLTVPKEIIVLLASKKLAVAVRMLTLAGNID